MSSARISRAAKPGRRIRGGAVALLMAATGLAVVVQAPAARADAPSNDDIAHAQALVGAQPVSVAGTNVEATREPGERGNLGSVVGQSVWYSWTAPGDAADHQVQVSLAGSDFDTTLAVYAGAPAPFSNPQPVAENDDEGGSTSRVRFDATVGTTYYIAVDGFYDGTSSASGVIQLSLHYAAAITGTVTDAGADPIRDICVSAAPSDGSGITTSDTTTADGTYTLTGLGTGPYDVSYHDCAGEFEDQWYDGAATAAEATEVDVVPGAITSGIDAELVRAVPFGSIAGTVTDDSGDPISDGCATARLPNGDLGGVGHFDQDGTYLIRGLGDPEHLESELRYVVNFFECGGMVGAEYYDNAIDQADAELVTVSLGLRTSGVDAVLQTSAPSNTTRPTVTGDVAVAGATLTADHGDWLHDPRSFAYDWQRCQPNGSGCASIDGATGSTYVTTDDDNGHRIRVVVSATNTVGTTDQSSALTPVVGGGDPVPANDDIDNAEVLGGALPISTSGSNVNASREPGEPHHYNFPEGTSVWYAWTAPSGDDAVDAVQVRLADSGFDTVLAVYDGDPSPISGLRAVASNDDAGDGSATSRVGFAPVPGRTYYIAVDGFSGATGSIQLVLSVLPNPTGTISGVVTDPDGAPASGVCAQVVDAGNQPIGTVATTNSDGYYELTTPAGPDNHVLFRNCGAGNVAGEYYADVQTLAEATDVAVAVFGTTFGVSAQLARGGTIAGTLMGPEDAPADNVCVLATKVAGGDPDATLTTVTGSDGGYSLAGLDGGDYVVRFGGDDRCDDTDTSLATEYYNLADAPATRPEDGEVLSVVEGEEITGIDATLVGAPGRIRGHVYSGSTGQPVAGICVQATGPAYSSQIVDTRDDGRYTIPDMPAGAEYVVEFSNCNELVINYATQYYDHVETSAEATPVTVADGEDTTGIDADLQADRGRITGTVTDQSDVPIRDVCVAALPDTGPGAPQIGYTRGNGTYTVAGLEPGTYLVSFFDCAYEYETQWYDGVTDPDDALPVTVVEGEATGGIDAKLNRLTNFGSISGTVRGDEGDPIEDVSVVVTLPDGSYAGETITHADGTYRVRGLGDPDRPADSVDYVVEFHDCTCSGEFGSEFFDNALSTDDAHAVAVTFDQQTVGVDAVLQDTAPSSTTLPSISGGTFVGATLTAGRGDWEHEPSRFERQWERCDVDLVDCEPVGDGAATYVTTPDDLGFRFRVVVSATNSVGTTDAVSDATSPIGRLPASTSPPVLTGAPVVGETMSTTDGGWSEDPTSFAYRWARCDTSGNGCTTIPGATGPTYVLTGDEVGGKIRATVTATNAVGSALRRGWSRNVIRAAGSPESTTPPVLTGTPVVGETMSTTDGGWSGDPTSFAYRWARCDATGNGCITIPGATSSTYVTTTDDVGGKIRATVTAANTVGSALRRGWSRTVIGAAGSPESTTPPVLTGTPVVGETMSTTDGGWSGDPTSFAYQWARCDATGNGCTSIPGATGPTYVLTGDEVGGKIRATVTATNTVGSALRRGWSKTVIRAAGTPAATTAPVITGSSLAGSALSVTEGAWDGDPDEITYRWARCDATGNGCTAIPGATSSTYVTTTDDVGGKVRAKVVATNAIGSTHRFVWSGRIKNVAPASLLPPVVSGTPGVDETLSATAGTWLGVVASYAYQWARCSAAGDDCADVPGATGPAYTATVQDLGSTLRVTVTATNSLGSSTRSALSDLLGEVGAFSLAGTCGQLGLTGPGFVLTADPARAIPAGTTITALASGTANAGSWSTSGGATISTLSGTARQITLTAPIAAGASKEFRTTLSIASAFTLNATASLPSGYTATGGKSSGSVSSTLIMCSAT